MGWPDLKLAEAIDIQYYPSCGLWLLLSFKLLGMHSLWQWLVSCFLSASCIPYFFPFFLLFSFSSFTISSFFSLGAAADMDLFLLLPFPSSRFHFHILPALPEGIHLSQSVPDLPTALIIRECLPASLLPTSFSDPIPANFLVSTPGEERIHFPFFQRRQPSRFLLPYHLQVNEQLWDSGLQSDTDENTE